jgi:hypothetical protein
MMYPFYLFVIALAAFLLYSYRREILDKIGYQRINEDAIGQSVDNLQNQLQGTADRIVEELAAQYSQLHLLMEESKKMAERLEGLVAKAEVICIELDARKERQAKEHSEAVPKDLHEQEIQEDPRLRIVCQMADHGMDIHEISNGTGIGYSEVRLLLNIARKKTQTEHGEKNGRDL